MEGDGLIAEEAILEALGDDDEGGSVALGHAGAAVGFGEFFDGEEFAQGAAREGGADHAADEGVVVIGEEEGAAGLGGAGGAAAEGEVHDGENDDGNAEPEKEGEGVAQAGGGGPCGGRSR